MTLEQRLNQIEPLLAEHSVQLDLHTAQLLRIAYGIQTITESIVKQSDNVTFLLEEVAEMRSEIGAIKAETAEVKADVSQIKDIVVAIYQAIQKPSGN